MQKLSIGHKKLIMNNTPLVSILMNCFNGDKHLREAIDSVINQTYQNWELIFWDNQSTDRSKEIFDSYNDPRLKYFLANCHTDLGKARGLALKKIKGELICFLDCDDLYSKHKLKIQVSFMQEEKFLMSYSSVDIVNHYGKIIRSLEVKNSSGYMLSSLLKKYEINMQTVMLRSELLQYSWCNFDPRLTYSPDYDLFLQIASKFPVGVIGDTLVQYRIVDNSLSSQKLGVVSREMKITLDKIFDNDKKLTKNNRKAFIYAYQKLNYYDAIFNISKSHYQTALRNIYPIRFVSFYFFALYLMILTMVPKNLILKILRRA